MEKRGNRSRASRGLVHFSAKKLVLPTNDNTGNNSI